MLNWYCLLKIKDHCVCTYTLTQTSTKLLYKTICVCVLSHFSRVQLFVTLWTVACEAPLSMRLSWQEYWNGLPFPPPVALLTLGLTLCLLWPLHWQADSSLSHLENPYETIYEYLNDMAQHVSSKCGCQGDSCFALCSKQFHTWSWSLDRTPELDDGKEYN